MFLRQQEVPTKVTNRLTLDQTFSFSHHTPDLTRPPPPLPNYVMSCMITATISIPASRRSYRDADDDDDDEEDIQLDMDQEEEHI